MSEQDADATHRDQSDGGVWRLVPTPIRAVLLVISFSILAWVSFHDSGMLYAGLLMGMVAAASGIFGMLKADNVRYFWE